ncbi:MAG: recombinase family protein [Candidatus Nomurabacteria bacterium]|nr:MAG: recombinase family protein [Candidatus Nomurabacteria bacterium]
MKRAAVYVRVSTANQEDEETIENQLMELKERIKNDGALLLPECIYSDNGWTGTLLERPDLDRLRSDAKEGAFDLLYYYDRGRIARKFVYQEVVLDELQESGIECISLHDINGTTPEEILMGSVMGVFHEYERIKITERMRLGKMRKVRENGKLLGYNACYGYDYHHRIKGGPDERDGYFSINEQEAEVVRQVFKWVADGVSLREVIRRLHALGIPPKKQKRTTWTKGPIARMLTNTTYIGKHFYNKSEAVETKSPKDPNKRYRRIKKSSRKVRPKEEWLEVKVDPIISKELFERVQQQMVANLKFSHRNNKKNEYLLTGLISCSCGKPRTGDPTAKGHLYYRCTDRLSRFPLPRECFAGGVNVVVLDTMVWSQIKELVSNPKLVRRQAERWLADSTSSAATQQAQETLEQLTRLDEEEKRYVKAFGMNYLSERLYKEQMDELYSKRAALQAKMNDAKEQMAQQPMLTVEQMVDGVQVLLESLDFTDKKAIIRRLVTKVKATQEEAIIWGQLPIFTKAEVGFEPKYRHRRPSKCRQINTLQRPDRG